MENVVEVTREQHDLAETLLSAYRENVEIYRERLAHPVRTARPYIIKCGGIYISSEIEGNKTTGKVSWTDNPVKAKHFSKENAHLLAENVNNGAGETGVAVLEIPHVASELQRANEMIQLLEARMALFTIID